VVLWSHSLSLSLCFGSGCLPGREGHHQLRGVSSASFIKPVEPFLLGVRNVALVRFCYTALLGARERK
jgi:hypothetical protein